MQLRSTFDAASNEARRSVSEVQRTLDSAFDRLVAAARAKIDVADLLTRLFARIRR
jgi:hypothetical protein